MFRSGKLIISFLLLFVVLSSCDEPAKSDIDYDSIEDEALRNCVAAFNQGLYAKEVNAIFCPEQGVRSIKGLEQFPNLATLILNVNSLHDVDFSIVPSVQYLDISRNRFTSIDLSGLPELLEVNLSENRALTSVNFSNNPKLESILIFETNISFLDLSKNLNLEELVADQCEFNGDVSAGALDLSNNTKLINLNLFKNEITRIDLSKNENLDIVNLAYNELDEIDLSNNTNISELRIHQNNLTALDLIFLKELDTLVASDNQISEIALPLNKKLRFAELANNQISCDASDCNGQSTFQIPINDEFIRLNLSNNLLESGDIELASYLGFTELILSGNTAIDGVFDLSLMTDIVEVRLDNTNIESINFANLDSFENVFNVFQFLQVLTARDTPFLDEQTKNLISAMNNNKDDHPTGYDPSLLCYASQVTDTCGGD